MRHASRKLSDDEYRNADGMDGIARPINVIAPTAGYAKKSVKGDDVRDHRKHHAWTKCKHKKINITPWKFEARQPIRRQRGHDQHADDGHAYIDKRPRVDGDILVCSNARLIALCR